LGGPELRADWLNIGIADEIEDSVLDPPFISEHGCSHANSFDLARLEVELWTALRAVGE